MLAVLKLMLYSMESQRSCWRRVYELDWRELVSACTEVRCFIIITRMWANAQRDGRSAEHRWRPLLNAAKFG